MNTLRQQEETNRHGRGRNQQVQSINPLLICYQNAWQKLKKYNNLTDEAHEIYAAATLLNPCCRKAYFVREWTSDAAAYIEPMIEKNRQIWESEYSQRIVREPSVEFHSSLDQFLAGSHHDNEATTDEDFQEYIDTPAMKMRNWKTQNLFHWWSQYPSVSLRQWAYDVLSIPAMSAEIERVFSSSKRSITADRNRLSVETFESLQCMKHWIDNEVLEQH
jgi:hypothetical protein